ncbi:hypothetical protein VTJ04DRAFT_298 [Mycothermus thermophilus]|uniref:uncharacterized protein n=1 Tax=Humicola insolens TaxID=85995 RepID=UPI003742745D
MKMNGSRRHTYIHTMPIPMPMPCKCKCKSSQVQDYPPPSFSSLLLLSSTSPPALCDAALFVGPTVRLASSSSFPAGLLSLWFCCYILSYLSSPFLISSFLSSIISHLNSCIAFQPTPPQRSFSLKSNRPSNQPSKQAC